MRIDLPCCSIKSCRNQFDGNCTDRQAYERCDYTLIRTWNKLSEALPPIIREKIRITNDLYEIGDEAKIREQVSKPVLFRSPSFPKLCKEVHIDGTDNFESNLHVGRIIISDVIEGMCGNPDEDHRVILELLGMDNAIAIGGHDDSKLFKKVFNEVNDIEWICMNEL